MQQDKLRELLIKRLKREKQCYICKVTGIEKNTLSMFKTGRLSKLYDGQAELLERYLLDTEVKWMEEENGQ